MVDPDPKRAAIIPNFNPTVWRSAWQSSLAAGICFGNPVKSHFPRNMWRSRRGVAKNPIFKTQGRLVEPEGDSGEASFLRDYRSSKGGLLPNAADNLLKMVQAKMWKGGCRSDARTYGDFSVRLV